MEEKFHIFLKSQNSTDFKREDGLDVYGWTDAVDEEKIISIKTIPHKDAQKEPYIVLSKKQVIKLIEKLKEVI